MLSVVKDLTRSEGINDESNDDGRSIVHCVRRFVRLVRIKSSNATECFLHYTKQALRRAGPAYTASERTNEQLIAQQRSAAVYNVAVYDHLESYSASPCSSKPINSFAIVQCRAIRKERAGIGAVELSRGGKSNSSYSPIIHTRPADSVRARAR